jgi:TolB-like protein/DNA-binding winged helix-turn-helix (wHTH) protein
MEALATGDIFLFEGFRLDRRGGALSRRDECGDLVPVAIGSRALDILGVVVERPGDLVSKDELIAAVWPGTVVEDSNLTVQISALRRVLDQGRSEGSCIQTIAGRGYRFVAAVTRTKDEADTAAPAIAVDEPDSSGDPPPSAPVVSVGRRDSARLRHRNWVVGILTTLAVIGSLLGLAWNHRWFGNPNPPRLSIVVLPFTNLGDPDQQYFADGITEDLTTDLSRLSHMLVISRNTAFTFRNNPVDTKQISRELGVRYLLEGSVQRSGNQVRVSAQLIDAATDTHLWAERFDRGIDDLFVLQNEITGRIAIALNFALIGAEAARPTEPPDALDYILRGRAIYLKPHSRDNHVEAISLYDRALALDPRSVEAQSLLAGALAGRVLDGMTDSAAADIARAEGLAGKALATSPGSSLPHFARGQVLRTQGRCEAGIPEFEMVVALNRNSMGALASFESCKLLTGSIEEAIPLVEQTIRLSPREPNIGNWYYRIGVVHLLQSRTDEAILWLEKARGAMPAHPLPHAYLASAYALKAETERAAAELAEARGLRGEGSFSSIARMRTTEYWGVPKIRALFEATYFAGLRKAGVPEE